MHFTKKFAVSALIMGSVAAQAELRALDDADLSEVSGEGIGVTFEDVALYSSDHDAADSLNIRLTLDRHTVSDEDDDDYLVFSELRLNRASTASDIVDLNSVDSGGRFGSYDQPMYIGDLTEITESYTSLHNADGVGGLDDVRRSFIANYTAFPAAEKQQITRGIHDYVVGKANYGVKGNAYGDAGYGSYTQHFYDRVYPRNFFSSNGNISSGNLGNFYSTIVPSYITSIENFESELDTATDKFDLHLRIDSINDSNRLSSSDEQFLASVDVKGFRLYGTESYMWVHDAKQQANTPTRGLSFAATQGIRADAIIINADPGGARSSQLSLNGLDAFLPLGSVDQPLTLSTVNFRQITRGQWGTSAPLEAARPQLRIDIAALPQAARQVTQQGNIFVQSITFGDGNSDQLWVGTQDMPLRNEFGQVVTVKQDVDMYAFVPRTVVYNEQIALYNETALTPLPFIPNENLIEVKGIEIQRLVVTTQDL